MRLIEEEGGEESGAALKDLKCWFAVDENAASGSLFYLKPATEALWKGPYVRMHAALQRAAAAAHRREKLGKEGADAYRISITHAEVRAGVHFARALGTAPLGGLCGVLLLRRTLSGIDASHTEASTFTDLVGAPGVLGRDEDAAACLRELKGPELGAAGLPVARCLEHTIPWDARGVCPAAHAPYLRDSLDSICKILVGSVLDTAHVLRKSPEPHPLCVEVGAHWALARERAARHVGRADVLAVLRDFLLPAGCDDAAPPSVLVLVAESGAGKTSCLASAVAAASEALPAGGALIVRLLGTTAGSRDSDELLRSVAAQLEALVNDGNDGEGFTAPASGSELVDHVRALLASSAGRASPLLLVLDSLDQLDAQSASGGNPSSTSPSPLSWLAALVPLPQHVRLLTSTLPDADLGCLKALQDMAAAAPTGAFRFVSLERAPPSHWLTVIDAWLAADGRRLQARQKDELASVLVACPLPLMARLACAPARAWRSGDAPVLRQASAAHAAIPLGRSLVEMIDHLFEALELEHGVVLARRTFGLLAASLNGLSRTELLVSTSGLIYFLLFIFSEYRILYGVFVTHFFLLHAMPVPIISPIYSAMIVSTARACV